MTNPNWGRNNTCDLKKDDKYKGEQRCVCNRLICIVLDDTIEIKCAKCKRLVTIVTSGIKQIEYI